MCGLTAVTPQGKIKYPAKSLKNGKVPTPGTPVLSHFYYRESRRG